MKIIAFDTETHGLDWKTQHAFLASWADADGEYVADLSDSEQVQRFVNALDSADVLVCHNLPFDLHQVQETLGWTPNGHELHDTDTLSRVVNPSGAGGSQNHQLKNLAQTFVDPDAKKYEERIEEMGKSIGLRTIKQDGAYYEIWRAYPDVMEEYARKDARFTWDLFGCLRDRLDERNTPVYELERGVTPILYRAEERGVAIDLSAATELEDEYQPQHDALYASLSEALGEQALGGKGSEEALREGLLAAGIPLYRKTDTGQLSTAKFALQEFEDDYPVVSDLMNWRRLKRFLDTYLNPMLTSGGELHTSFLQCEAWTSRMSSRRPNMQNLPKRAGKEVRRPIVPREGHALVVCDYDGIEGRLLAYYMADEDYKQFYRDGKDPHAWMATQIHGRSMADYAEGTELRPLRDDAKNTFYAISYGAGGRRVSDMNNMDPGPIYAEDHPAVVAAQEQGRYWPKAGPQYAEGRALIRKIKSALPKYGHLQSRIRRKVEAEGCVHTLIGRTQRVNKNKAYVGLNALIQGSASDIFKQGIINVQPVMEELGGTQLLFVHDELVCEVPVENAEEALRRTQQAMEAAYELDPPLKVSGSVVTTNYADA